MTDAEAFPLPFLPYWKLPFNPPRTLRELEMMRFSALIRAKPDWVEKRADAEIVARWSREAADSGLTEAQIAYVLAELAYYAELRDVRTGIEVSAVDGVWQSERLIDAELTARLRAAVRVLEDVPDAELDWHPGSNGQVLDLVHPSLFCLVRELGNSPDDIWQDPGEQYETAHSKKFQWLPSEVDIDAGGRVEFASYINNVHPADHRELAVVLPEVLARMRPLFERVLTDLRNPRPARIVADPWGWYEDEPVYGDYGDEDAYYDARSAWYDNRVPVIPDAPEFSAPEVPEDFEPVDLRGRRVQVIVKLANIHLTPDKPDYPGGSWHVEGMMNERIVSTGIYYWDSENITESCLGFRAALDDPEYQQNDDDGVRAIYGLEDEDKLNQFLGSVPTDSGRCVAFPNILQHRVAPFSLTDPTRPGHRKILAFFLVDPTHRVTSTADVPPQQPWSPASTMTLDQAVAFRDELMKERKFIIDDHNEEELYEREFSLCEH
ncbi:DUF4246 domain-containing protein [Nocardia sp. NPDC055321]